jgi:hypothetical protein
LYPLDELLSRSVDLLFSLLNLKSNRGQYSNTSGSREPDESEITNTLSKAMSTLLKKIIFDDKVQDDSKEGRMADMVLDMVKARVNEDQGQDQTARLCC